MRQGGRNNQRHQVEEDGKRATDGNADTKCMIANIAKRTAQRFVLTYCLFQEAGFSPDISLDEDELSNVQLQTTRTG